MIETQLLTQRGCLNQHEVQVEGGKSLQHKVVVQPVVDGSMSFAGEKNLLSFSPMPAVWHWRRKHLRKKKKRKRSCVIGLVSSCFWELETGKQPRAIRWERSFLLEEEICCPLRKADVDWATCKKGAVTQ